MSSKRSSTSALVRPSSRGRPSAGRPPAASPLEWVAAILGALVAIALLALIAWDAATGPGRVPPALTVEWRCALVPVAAFLVIRRRRRAGAPIGYPLVPSVDMDGLVDAVVEAGGRVPADRLRQGAPAAAEPRARVTLTQKNMKLLINSKQNGINSVYGLWL